MLRLIVAMTACAPAPPSVRPGHPPPTLPGPTLRDVAFFQAVSVPVVEDGLAVADRNAPLIAGRDAVVRARIDVPDGWAPADVTLAVDLVAGGSTRTFTATGPISASSTDDDPTSGLLVEVPADAMTADADYVLHLSTGSGEGARFPDTGAAPLDAFVTGPLELVLVPFEVEGWTPDTSDGVVEGYRQALLATYPVTDVTVSVAPVQPWDGPGDLGDINVRVGELQEDAMFAGDIGWDVYYFGLATGPSRDAWDGVTGTSEDGGSEPITRAYFAAGAAFADQRSEDTLIHELGHVHGLDHAPCDGEGDVDPSFPYPDGSIGVEGYDRRTATFVPADTKDMMTYCYPRWLSDYDFGKLADHVAEAQFFAGPQ